MNNLPTCAAQSKPARQFAIGDVVRVGFSKDESLANPGSARSYHRYRILSTPEIGRYGYTCEVEDIDTGAMKAQGFGSWVTYVVEEMMNGGNLGAASLKDFTDEELEAMSAEDKRLEAKAKALGCSIELVGYIEALERRLAALAAGKSEGEGE